MLSNIVGVVGNIKKNAGNATPAASRKTPRPMGGFRFQSEIEPQKPTKAERAKRPKAPPAKVDAKYLRAARELRDRWMEHVNAGGMQLDGAGKYDVVRAIENDAATRVVMKQLRLAA